MSQIAIIEHIHKVCHREQCGFYPTQDKPIYCFGCCHYRDNDFSTLVAKSDVLANEQLKFVGSKTQQAYTGDGIDCKAGDIIHVSKAKKAQLLKDFSEWFVEPDKLEVKNESKPEPKKETKPDKGKEVKPGKKK